jgi:type IV pilus assembly protein PilC
MPKYTYKARDGNGKNITGTAEAVSLDEALSRLAERELIPLQVDELNFDGSKRDRRLSDQINDVLLRLQTRVSYKSVVFFTRQLATMVNSGVPLSHALGQLAEGEKPVFAKIIRQIADDIAMGSTFSDAVARHPGAFDDIYVAVVHSGEIAGALDKVLDELATYMENIQAIKEKVKGAMRYPAFIGLFVTVLISAILWKLVPVFEHLYGSFGAELPAATQLLISISRGIRHGFPLVLGGAVCLVAGFMAAMNTVRFKTFVHEYILLVPVFGLILRKNIWARFCRTMSLLLGSGTPILAAVEVTGAVVDNKMYSVHLEKVYHRLRTGELLSEALTSTKKFPVLIRQLVATGESAGRIDELLKKAADFYEREIRITVDSLAAIIEPFLIVILGVVVGGILIALYMPIFMVGRLVQ